MRLYELSGLAEVFCSRIQIFDCGILSVFSFTKSDRVESSTFRDTHKEIYCSRMYGKELAIKMNERYLYENS